MWLYVASKKKNKKDNLLALANFVVVVVGPVIILSSATESIIKTTMAYMQSLNIESFITYRSTFRIWDERGTVRESSCDAILEICSAIRCIWFYSEVISECNDLY